MEQKNTGNEMSITRELVNYDQSTLCNTMHSSEDSGKCVHADRERFLGWIRFKKQRITIHILSMYSIYSLFLKKMKSHK